MFRAIVLSSFVISVAIAANHGYKTLRSELDDYVANTYGRLETFEQPELKQTGHDVLSHYENYSLEQ